MTLLRPTLQARKGFDPGGIGPGLSAPYGYSSAYFGGSRMHNGQDYFWLGAESAARLGISTADSKGVYPVIAGPVLHVNDPALGTGLYQQIDATRRAYYWHLSSRKPAGSYSTSTAIGVMGSSGTATDEVHLHFEIRVAPYGFANRVNPEPYFTPPFDYTGPSFSGGSAPVEIITPDLRKATKMYLLKTTDGTVSLVTPNGIAHFTDMSHADLFVRLLETEPGEWDTFNNTQREIIRGYLHAASTNNDADQKQIIAAISKISVGGAADLGPILAAIKVLPEEFVQELKDAL